MKRLSGWVRLWLVTSTVIWALGLWSALNAEGLPPSVNLSDREVCVQMRIETDFREDVWLRECPYDPEVLRIAHARYATIVSTYPVRFLSHLFPALLAPFALAVLFIVMRWVWRGFRPPAT